MVTLLIIYAGILAAWTKDFNGRPTITFWIVNSFIVLMIILFAFDDGGGGSSHHTDGVYESATEKMDKGIPLNERENKRIEDILNYKDNERAKEIERRNGER